MKRLTAVTAAMLALGTAALAQDAGGAASDRRDGARPGMTRADMEALVDARVAAIQAGLKLTTDQQRYWPPVEQAIRAMAAERFARFERQREAWASRGGDDDKRPDFMERIERRAQRVTARAEAMKALSTAVRPLWTSLDERQRRLLPVLMRPSFRVEGGGGWRQGRMGHHSMHHRMERGEDGRRGGDGQRRNRE